MAKLDGVNLAEISTKDPILPEGEYSVEIKKVSIEPSKNKIPMVVLTTFAQNEGDPFGVPVMERITLKTKEGQPNDVGLRQLKRIIAAVLGEDRAEDPDFDTDELQGRHAKVYIVVENFTRDDGSEGQSNKIKRWLGAA